MQRQLEEAAAPLPLPQSPKTQNKPDPAGQGTAHEGQGTDQKGQGTDQKGQGTDPAATLRDAKGQDASHLRSYSYLPLALGIATLGSAGICFLKGSNSQRIQFAALGALAVSVLAETVPSCCGYNLSKTQHTLIGLGVCTLTAVLAKK